MKISLRYLSVIVLLSFSAHAQTIPEPLDRFPKALLSIYTADMHKHVFKIWVADTEPRREQGLMYIKSLGADQGMLFVFDVPQKISMWMKNTYIPLDMVFIDERGRVESIVINATPMSEKIISSKGAAATVLELNGGETRKLNIHPGAVVQIAE